MKTEVNVIETITVNEIQIGKTEKIISKISVMNTVAKINQLIRLKEKVMGVYSVCLVK